MSIKNGSGDCPECQGQVVASGISLEHPHMISKVCTTCLLYSTEVTHRGVTYPLTDPTDPLSGLAIAIDRG